MKRKAVAFLSCLLVLCSLLGCTVPVLAEYDHQTVARQWVDGILAYERSAAGAASDQAWIDGALTQTAGRSAEWYVLALSQSGTYRFDSYEKALLAYVDQHPVYSATTRQKYALTLAAVGSTNGYIDRVVNDAPGEQGVMSWIYGLHLLNNGYTGRTVTQSGAVQHLLDLQLADGGWAVIGSTGDVDVTAMALQALAPHKKQAAVAAAGERAFALLSGRQQANGAFAGYGAQNAESTAQVLCALSEWGIDAARDDRFVQNGHTVFDGLAAYRLADGSFCHAVGEGYNASATVQVLYTMVAYLRMCAGKPGLYVLDHANPAGLQAIASEPSSAVSAASSVPSAVSAVSSAPSHAPASSAPAASQPAVSQPASSAPSGPASSAVSAPSAVSAASAPASSAASAVATRPAATPTPTDPTVTATGVPGSGGYKLWACLGAMCLAGVVCLVLWLCRKRHYKNFLAVGICLVLAVALILSTNLQSATDYYHGQDAVKPQTVGQVTLTIRCDTVVGLSDADYIPADGCILDVTAFALAPGDTVFDIMEEAARKYGIQMDVSGGANMTYIAGINYLYEMQFGELSGWMYYVNGTAPSVNCGEYVLADGDRIEFLYSREIGKDL